MISGLHNSRYDKRSMVASPITMFVADGARESRHYARMMGSKELVAALERLKEAGATTNAQLSRLLNLPSSRVAEIFSGKRQIAIDEMKLLVEHFELESNGAAASAESLEPMLDALLPLAPPGRMTDQSRRALAEALAYGLGLLGTPSATKASSDAIAVAVRAAALRFRETAPAS